MNNIPEYRIKIKRRHLNRCYTEHVSDDWPGASLRFLVKYAPDHLDFWSEYGNYELLNVKVAASPLIFIQIYEK